MGRLRRAGALAAAALAGALLTWLAAGPPGPRREWLAALRAELDAIDGGGERLAWALGGLRLAWALEGRRRMAAGVRGWVPGIVRGTLGGALVVVGVVAGRLGVGMTGLAVLSALALALGWALWPRRSGDGRPGDAPRRRWPRVLALPAVAVGVLLVGGAVATVGAASQPDTQCATRRPVASAPPAEPLTAADYLALGDAAYDRGACDEAIAAYSRAIELDPHFAEAYNNRAYTAMRRQDYAAALADLDAAIALRPDYGYALMNRGDIYNYYYRVDRRRAIADYDRVLALGPGADGSGSLCGHRLLAYYDGWSPAVVLNLLTRGTSGGCALGHPAPGA
jgi:tetratricopeptide (TPR) repeat protein